MTRAKVLGELDFLEEKFLTRAGVPSAKSLRKWRQSVDDATKAKKKPNAGFSLIAPDGVLGSSDERATAVTQIAKSVEALSADVVVFRTPKGLSPSQTNRERFIELCTNEATSERLGGVTRVLWPRGLWDYSVATALTSELDLLLCFDPLANDPLEELPNLVAGAFDRGGAYFRLDKIGSPRHRYDPYELETLADIISEIGGGSGLGSWTSFAHSERVRDATALKKLLAS